MGTQVQVGNLQAILLKKLILNQDTQEPKFSGLVFIRALHYFNFFYVPQLQIITVQLQALIPSFTQTP